MRTSMGALQIDNRFLSKNSRGERVISARRPKVKVIVASDSPMTVRYWKCHPYASLLREGPRVNFWVSLGPFPGLIGAYAKLGLSCILEGKELVKSFWHCTIIDAEDPNDFLYRLTI